MPASVRGTCALAEQEPLGDAAPMLLADVSSD
jgi:hypothetical protein